MPTPCLLVLALAAAAQEAEAAPQVGYDGAFFVRDRSGANELTVGGLFQVDGLAFESGLAGRDGEFVLRRMRFELGGRLDEIYRFNVEPNFHASGVELEEAWGGVELAGGDALLMLGRMKEPFSLEEMAPRRQHEFVAFSILNQFVPAEDHGITLNGEVFARRLWYGAALYNGTGGDERNSDKDVAGRLVYRPFAATGDPWTRGLQFGGAATYGVAEQELAGAALNTEAKVPFAAFAPGSALDGRRWRLGAEAAWLAGPFAASGEFVRVLQRAAGAGGRGDADLDAWYLAASWLLTGEEREYRRIQPRSSWGAWQVAARVSNLALDQAFLDLGLLAPAAYPERVHSYDLGLNWIANAHLRVKLHLLHTVFAESIVLGGERRGGEDALLLQFQLAF